MKRNIVPPPVVAVLSLLLMWILARGLPLGSFAGPGLTSLGGALAIFGIVIMVVANRQFAKAGTTVNPLDPSKATSLVDEGIFARSRNPMYLGMAMILVGFALYLGALSALIIPLGFVYYITNFQIKPEEEALTGIFGDPYKDYCNKVRRWM